MIDVRQNSGEQKVLLDPEADLERVSRKVPHRVRAATGKVQRWQEDGSWSQGGHDAHTQISVHQ
jgi:hypothetical protein